MLAVHPTSVAATRLRAIQYGPAFAAVGIEVRIWTFLREGDLEDWFSGGTPRRVRAVVRGLLRLGGAVRLLRRAGVVLVQREAMPLGPPVLEALAARWSTLVWDVDDAIWADFTLPTARRVPRWLRATGNKFDRIAGMANEVWAGSDVLAEWARKHSATVHVVPTVVEVPDRLLPAGQHRTVGWIGSPSTAPFVEAVLPALVTLDPPPRALVVGGDVDLAGLDGEVVPWTPEAEAEALAVIRVGLYPIESGHPLADGKCGLKAILFLAHGVPVVVTPTPTNAAIVRDGVDGLHATTPDTWAEQVRRLLDDTALWERLRTSGHERVRDGYSLAVWGPKVAERARALF